MTWTWLQQIGSHSQRSQRSLGTFERGLERKHQNQIAALKEAEGRAVSLRKISASNKSTSSVLPRQKWKEKDVALLKLTMWHYFWPPGKNSTLMNSIAESLSFTFINWRVQKSVSEWQWMCCYPKDCLEKGQTGTARRLRHCEEKRNRNPLGFSRWTIQDEGMREERASVITSARGPTVSDEQLIGCLRRSVGSPCSHWKDIDVFLNCIRNHNRGQN